MRKLMATSLAAGLVVALAPAGHAYPRPGLTIRVNPTLDATGEEAGAGAGKISGNGRFVVFPTGSRLLPGDANGTTDLYVRDLQTGGLERASLTHDGKEPNSASNFPSISGDGRYVAFQSTATNLVPGDTNGFGDVFVRDLVAGTTMRASLADDESQAANSTTSPSISNDGGRVAFLSSAPNLVSGDVNSYADVFVRDLVAGTTEIASVGSDETQGVTAPVAPSISGDGRHVVFVHRMPWGSDRSSYDDVWVRDLQNDTTELVSVASNGNQGNGNSFYPSISDDGRYVAFGTFSTDLVPNDFNGGADAFVRDRQTGITERVSVRSDGGELNQVTGIPIISGDGRFTTGNYLPTNLGYEDTNGNTDVYVYDRVTHTAELASGTLGSGGTHTGNGISYSPSLSDDGRRVIFLSEATDLLPDDAGGGHVYLRDLGPALGIGGLSAAPAGDMVEISGFARFNAGPLLRSGDPANDGEPGAQAIGAELTGTSVTYRPEEGDLLFRLDLAPRRHLAAPLLGTTARRPGALTYGVELDSGGTRYEVRATQKPDLTGALFELFRCTATCEKAEDLTGGDGTIGDAVVVSVPVDKLGGEGAELSLRKSFSSLQQERVTVTLDDIALGPVTVPRATLEIGIAPQGSDPRDVAFEPAPALDGGVFGGTLPLENDREVWARACFGSDCRTSRAAVA